MADKGPKSENFAQEYRYQKPLEPEKKVAAKRPNFIDEVFMQKPETGPLRRKLPQLVNGQLPQRDHHLEYPLEDPA